MTPSTSGPSPAATHCRTSTRSSRGCPSSSTCSGGRCSATGAPDRTGDHEEEAAMADTENGPAPAREQRFQRRMSDAEALMWNVEKDPWLNPSGGSFSILDRMPDVEHLRAQLAAAVVTVPRLMEHVVGGL